MAIRHASSGSTTSFGLLAWGLSAQEMGGDRGLGESMGSSSTSTSACQLQEHTKEEKQQQSLDQHMEALSQRLMAVREEEDATRRALLKARLDLIKREEAHLRR